jgi:SAM-dependent methyltransferase
MAHQFPVDMVPLLRCNVDAGELVIASKLRGDGNGLLDAVLRCRICGAEFPVEDGIVRLMPRQLSPEDQHEMIIRDTIDYDLTNVGPFVPPAEGWRSVLSDMLEIPPHLNELRPLPSSTVLELACGDGRLTIPITETGARVLAVDISLNALRLLSHRLPSNAKVGRVQADINHLYVANRSFDRALALTPLDSRDERMIMYRMIANALTDDGRYIASLEHDDLSRRLLGLPVMRRYSKGGILIEHLTPETMRREAAPYFSKVRTLMFRPRVPFVAKLPLRLAFSILQLITALPILNQFGELLLLTAERPVRIPAEGEYRPGNRLAKAVYRSYMHRKDQEPLWGEELV